MFGRGGGGGEFGCVEKSLNIGQHMGTLGFDLWRNGQINMESKVQMNWLIYSTLHS